MATGCACSGRRSRAAGGDGPELDPSLIAGSHTEGQTSMRPFTRIASGVLAVVCLGHIARLAFGWAVTVGPWSIPMWVSVIGTAATALLSAMLWRESRTR